HALVRASGVDGPEGQGRAVRRGGRVFAPPRPVGDPDHVRAWRGERLLSAREHGAHARGTPEAQPRDVVQPPRDPELRAHRLHLRRACRTGRLPVDPGAFGGDELSTHTAAELIEPALAAIREVVGVEHVLAGEAEREAHARDTSLWHRLAGAV